MWLCEIKCLATRTFLLFNTQVFAVVYTVAFCIIAFLMDSFFAKHPRYELKLCNTVCCCCLCLCMHILFLFIQLFWCVVTAMLGCTGFSEGGPSSNSDAVKLVPRSCQAVCHPV